MSLAKLDGQPYLQALLQADRQSSFLPSFRPAVDPGEQQAQSRTLALPDADPGRSSSLHSEDCRVEAQPLPLGRCPLDSELAIFWLRRPLLLSELLSCLPPAGLPGGMGAACIFTSNQATLQDI